MLSMVFSLHIRKVHMSPKRSVDKNLKMKKASIYFWASRAVCLLIFLRLPLCVFLFVLGGFCFFYSIDKVSTFLWWLVSYREKIGTRHFSLNELYHFSIKFLLPVTQNRFDQILTVRFPFTVKNLVLWNHNYFTPTSKKNSEAIHKKKSTLQNY